MRLYFATILLLVASVFSADAANMELKNVVCFVRFSDQAEAQRVNDAPAIDALFNSESTDDNSVWRYFHDTSYGALSWQSYIVPVEYCDSHARGYFCPQSDTNPDGYTTLIQGYMREQTLIKDMCAAVQDSIPADIKVDGNKDWEVDNLLIVVLGNSDPSSSSLLWPHQNTMVWAKAYIHDYEINNYLMVFDGVNGAHALNPGVICHEMMHALDAYDLYSNGKLDPVGKWDLMSDNQTVPQGLTAYMRYAYGRKYGNWIPDIRTLDEPGTYKLRPIYSETPDDVAYIIKPDPKRQEYFMVEYRRKTGWDAMIPSSGLICYRINPDVSSNLAASKFEIYVFRPDGSLSSKGTLDKANFNATVRRSQFGIDDTYYPFYSDGTRADFALCDIGKAEEDGIEFTLIRPSAGVEAVNLDAAALYYEAATMTVYGTDQCQIDIFAVSGTLVMSGTETLCIESLPKGVYVAKAMSPLHGTMSLKILKNR